MTLHDSKECDARAQTIDVVQIGTRNKTDGESNKSHKWDLHLGGIGCQGSHIPADTAVDVVQIGSNDDTGHQMVSFDMIEKCVQLQIFHMAEAPLGFCDLMTG